MAAHRFAPGQQEVDIYFPIRVSGRIKNMQQGVIAVKNIDREGIGIFQFSRIAVILSNIAQWRTLPPEVEERRPGMRTNREKRSNA